MPEVVGTTLAKFTRTAATENDLLSIWRYIAKDNPKAADRLLIELDEKCAILADNPLLGPSRSDIAPDLRYFPVGRYVILYREATHGVEIVRILHGARQRAVEHFLS
ncbi:MAG: type II toxin-antitoxin system RelE/ParE family toxin [Magnetococcales bacterium]|nr:type II toxin-antitoxin system RelE/ParE family toxin [Magnetococcales bacterium]